MACSTGRPTQGRIPHGLRQLTERLGCSAAKDFRGQDLIGRLALMQHKLAFQAGTKVCLWDQPLEKSCALCLCGGSTGTAVVSILMLEWWMGPGA